MLLVYFNLLYFTHPFVLSIILLVIMKEEKFYIVTILKTRCQLIGT